MNDLLPVKFDAGGEVYYSDTPVFSAPPPPPPRAQNSLLPANFDWTKGSQIIDGITYTRGVEGQVPGEGGAMEGGYFNNQIFRNTPGQNTYEELDPTGKVVARHVGEKDRGFFGNLISHASSIAETVGPVAQYVPGFGQAITAINAINAAARGDFLPAIGTLAGMGGYTDVANAAKIANAVKNEDVIGAVMPALGIAGLTDVGGVSDKDISKGIGALRAIESGNPLRLLNVASSYLPGPAMPGTTGNEITEGFFDRDGPGFMPTASETAVGGGAETSGFFDAEEAQAVQDDIDSLLARYPETSSSFFPEFDAPLLTAEPLAPAPAPSPSFTLPSDEVYEDIENLLIRYPDAYLGGKEAPSTNMEPRELNQFLEANIEDPGTIETLMQEYFPELYRQRVEVTGTPTERELFPEFDQPLLTAEPPAPAPTPAPSPAPSPAPAPAPTPAPPAPSPAAAAKKKKDDLALLMMLSAMMTPQQKQEENYQVARILNLGPMDLLV